MSESFGFVVAALAAWRLCHLVAHEDGPFDAIAILRRRAGQGQWGRWMDCPYCLSLWFALPLAFFSAGSKSAARMAMIATTTSNSMSVKPLQRFAKKLCWLIGGRLDADAQRRNRQCRTSPAPPPATMISIAALGSGISANNCT